MVGDTCGRSLATAARTTATPPSPAGFEREEKNTKGDTFVTIDGSQTLSSLGRRARVEYYEPLCEYYEMKLFLISSECQTFGLLTPPSKVLLRGRELREGRQGDESGGCDLVLDVLGILLRGDALRERRGPLEEQHQQDRADACAITPPTPVRGRGAPRLGRHREDVIRDPHALFREKVGMARVSEQTASEKPAAVIIASPRGRGNPVTLRLLCWKSHCC